MLTVLLYALLYLGLFFCTDVLYHRYGVPAEYTRKIVHACTGIIALTFPYFLTAFWQVSLLCASFLVLLLLSERRGWFPSITAIKRVSFGSWLFAAMVWLCFWVQLRQANVLYYYVPLLVLTLADPAAAIVGKQWRFRPYRIGGQLKTLGGSIAFFVLTLAVLWLTTRYTSSPLPVYALPICAFVLTLSEAVGVRGWDNLLIPTTALVCLYIFNY